VAPSTALGTVFDLIPAFCPFFAPRHGPLAVRARPAGQVLLVTFEIAHLFNTVLISSLDLWMQATTDFTK
jgi:hypothetical protein